MVGKVILLHHGQRLFATELKEGDAVTIVKHHKRGCSFTRFEATSLGYKKKSVVIPASPQRAGRD